MSNNKKRIILIDGDIIAYRVACRYEKEHFGLKVPIGSILDAYGEIDVFIKGLMDKLDGCCKKVYLTGTSNFRKDVLSTYKMNRKKTQKPLRLSQLKGYMESDHDAIYEDRLEADDLMGLESARIDAEGSHEPVIATIDKDLKMCYHADVYFWNHQEITKLYKAEAIRFHMFQTLTGDSVDGYKGCPRIGKVKADKILDEAESFFNTYKVDDQLNFSKEIYWNHVIGAYEAQGLTEADALVQARCAYILHEVTDYNFETKEVNLWTAP